MRRAAQQVRGRLEVERELGFEEQAVFYSDAIYTAVHTLVSVPQLQTIDSLAAHLSVSRVLILEVVDWLLLHGLLKGSREKLETGSRSTYVDRNSPLATRHHTNWRIRSLEVMRKRSENDFFFTAPFSVSKNDLEAIRNELSQLIEKIVRRVGKSDPELMATLNIDLFRS